MKKFLLTLATAAAVAFGAAADEVTFNFAENTYGCTPESGNSTNYLDPETTTITEGPVTITIQKYEYEAGKFGNGARFWDASGKITFRVMNNSGITVAIDGGTISEISATGNSGLDKISTGDLTKSSESTASAATWTGSASSVVFKATNTVQFTSMTVTYTGGVVDTRLAAGLEFSETEVSAVMGKAFTAPELTFATNAAITYSSDKEDVATVDATTGAVTLVAPGTARITAVAEANDEYKAGSASYLLTVAPDALFWSKLGEGFTFENPEGLTIWKLNATYGLYGSGYVNSAANAGEGVAVSPVIDLTECEGATLEFDNAFNNFKLDNVMISVEDFEGEYAFVVVREEGETAWSELALPTTPEEFSWTFYANEPIDLAAYAGKKIQFGFKYVSTDEVAGTWEVQNVAVYAKKESGVAETVAADSEAAVEYFNLQGVRVANPENGLYIRRQGSTVTKVLVK